MKKNAFLLLMVIPLSFFNVIKAQNKIEDLDKAAAFSFSIMSDNKGYSTENPAMKKCDLWIREGGDSFILGLGDHVKKNRPNPFLSLIAHDSLWHDHFYPNVADGENEYWGKGQGDWGAGAPILDSVDLSHRKNVQIRDNKCEYYAIEKHEGITVHIVQLHYSDSPDDPNFAFNESSRQYLMDILDSIDKTNKDIIVVLAHDGPWVEQLSAERKTKLMNKADLVLGATTHIFQRYYFLGKDVDTGAASFNTGAVGNSLVSGFLQVHVLKNPTRMVVQYQMTHKDDRQLQDKGFAFEKVINGKTSEIDWADYKIGEGE